MEELKGTQEFSSLKEIGIRISKNMEVINGSIIPMPKITLGDNCSIEDGK
jgi:hypothetical protein